MTQGASHLKVAFELRIKCVLLINHDKKQKKVENRHVPQERFLFDKFQGRRDAKVLTA